MEISHDVLEVIRTAAYDYGVDKLAAKLAFKKAHSTTS